MRWGLILKVTLVLGLSVGCPLLFALSPAAQHLASTVLEWLRSEKWLGKGICVGLEAAGLMVGLPVSFINVGVGVIYPFWTAYLVTWVACLLGTAASYSIGRYCLSLELHSAVAEKLHIDLDVALQQGPWKLTILIWLIYAPMCLKNYWLASLAVPFHVYLTVAMTNCVYMNALHVYIGSKAGSVLEAWNHGHIPWYDGLLAVSAILLTIIASYLLVRFLKASMQASSQSVEFQHFGEAP